MRIVAIRALHEAFIDTVLEGHRKLRAHGCMASIAELALLLFCEKKLRRRRAVNRMAVGAYNVALGMLTAANVGAGNRLAVAAQAGVQHFFRRNQRERDRNRGLAAARVYVILTGSVTTFAAGVF